MISMKKLEDKLEKKKIRLKKLLAEKDKLEIKIKELRADIEKLQASQFEQFKKAAKRENIEIRVDDIPEILQLIKNFSKGQKLKLKKRPISPPYSMIHLLSRLVQMMLTKIKSFSVMVCAL